MQCLDLYETSVMWPSCSRENSGSKCHSGLFRLIPQSLLHYICPTKEVLGVGLEIIMPYCQVVQHVCLVCYTGQGGMSIL